MGERMAVVCDTDCGIDDFAAMLLLRRHCRLLAVTLVHGNVRLSAARAAAALLFDQSLIYDGCQGPLMGEPLPGWPGHGADGLGDEGERVAAMFEARAAGEGGVRPQTHASVRLAELGREHPGLTVLAIGPLTNLAVALMLDPSWHERVARLVIMGGALHGKGNSSEAAEFNFHADPEAVHKVLAAFGTKAEVVPWETTVACPLPWSWADDKDSVLAWLVRKYRSMAEGGELVMCDLMAAAVCVDPTLASKKTELGVRVALGGEARGAMLVDWYGRHGLPRVAVVEHVDVARVLLLCADIGRILK